MAKVLGLGGIFFKAADPKAVREWYARVLGFRVHDWGGAMFEPSQGRQDQLVAVRRRHQVFRAVPGGRS
jgi:catechol 2,3-dioxygenase-like lactoylglutathione lyase family enzyme